MIYNKIYNENCLTGMKNLPDNSIDCCVTSPPYFGLRDYGNDQQIGLENTPDLFVAKLVEVFSEVNRVLKPEGTLWLNLGDSYSGSGKGIGDTTGDRWKQSTNKGTRTGELIKVSTGLKPKDLIGIPWMVAFALRSAGWYLRQDIIWHKPNPMPESVTDRCTKSHEYIFLLSKSQKYFYNHIDIMQDVKTQENRPSGVERNRIYDYDSKENNNPEAYRKSWNGSGFKNGKTGEMMKTHGGRKSGNKERKHSSERGCPENNGKNQAASVPWEGTKANKRSVWTVTTKPFKEAHFATFPEELIVDCIKAGCPENGIVLDPFMGAGTTALVAKKLNRNYIGFELNPEYIEIAEKRLYSELGMFQ